MIMGYNLTMLSLMSILGLAGVIVNDSIVLVSTVKQGQRDGAALHEAAIEAARQRLRPVLLTAFTTVGGLTPLLFERSLQAQLIQPLAVTLIFGLMFAPLLILFLVPALLGIGDDLRRWFRPAPAAAGQAA
jgi:multidrug efflux pump subunit AcrB